MARKQASSMSVPGQSPLPGFDLVEILFRHVINDSLAFISPPPI